MTVDRAPDPADVVLTLPAEAEFLRAVRLLVAAVATLLQFGYDEVEDLRRAADEMCHSFIVAARPGDRLRLGARLEKDRMIVEVGYEDPALGRIPEISELSHRILVSLVDEYDIALDAGGNPVGFLVKVVPVGQR